MSRGQQPCFSSVSSTTRVLCCFGKRTREDRTSAAPRTVNVHRTVAVFGRADPPHPLRQRKNRVHTSELMNRPATNELYCCHFLIEFLCSELSSIKIDKRSGETECVWLPVGQGILCHSSSPARSVGNTTPPHIPHSPSVFHHYFLGLERIKQRNAAVHSPSCAISTPFHPRDSGLEERTTTFLLYCTTVAAAETLRAAAACLRSAATAACQTLTPTARRKYHNFIINNTLSCSLQLLRSFQLPITT